MKWTVTIDSTEINRLLKNIFKNLMLITWKNLEVRDRFLDIDDLSKFSRGHIELNKGTTRNESCG